MQHVARSKLVSALGRVTARQSAAEPGRLILETVPFAGMIIQQRPESGSSLKQKMHILNSLAAPSSCIRAQLASMFLGVQIT